MTEKPPFEILEYPIGDLLRKGTRPARVPTILTSQGNQIIFIPRDFGDYGEQEVRSLFQLLKVPRLTVTFEDRSAYQALDLPASQYFAWYSLSVQTTTLQEASYDQTEDHLLSVKQYGVGTLPSPIRDDLVKSWEHDYLNKTLGPYPKAIRQQQRESYLTVLSKSDHVIYSHGSRETVAHFSYFNFYHPLYEAEVTAIHKWVRSNLARDHRRGVHADSFRKMENLPNLAAAGINVLNQKSLAHFLANGFQIDYVAIKQVESEK